MARKRICVSFDYTHDNQYRSLLRAWNVHPGFEFRFLDRTPDEIQSRDVSRIKAVLTSRIKASTYLLVIIGRYANRKDRRAAQIGDVNWQNWEVNKAKALGKRLVAVKIDRGFDSPEAVLNSGASWAMAFTEEAIVDALEKPCGE